MKWRRAKIRQMSHRTFKRWCYKHLSSLRKKEIVKEEVDDEYDSWGNLSHQGGNQHKSSKVELIKPRKHFDKGPNFKSMPNKSRFSSIRGAA